MEEQAVMEVAEQGGRGAGYYWNGNNAFIDIQTASSRNGAGGGGGQRKQ